jgi:RecB family exonuclease
MAVEHISFSSWKDWLFCPYKFKLTRIDKVKGFEGNEYTTFGTAVHDTAEQMVLLEKQKALDEGVKDDNAFDPIRHFEKRFREELDQLPKQKLESIPQKTITEMKQQGAELVPLILPALKEYFGDFEVFHAEYELRQPIENHTHFDFTGIADLIIKTPDGKFHIIDWKTCSWGWDMEKRTSKEYTYQLTYYKHFFSKQLNIDPQMVETHFGLFKRTAKKDKVELFRVTSGPKKVSNALNILDKCATNVEKGNFIRNKLNCTKCDFKGTVYCP